MDYSLIIPAFIAGLLTFLAPCTLPLVPGYLGFISEVSLTDLKNLEKARQARFRIFLNGLAFMAGFSLIFIAFGALAGFLGSALAPYRIWLSRLGGIFVILFGLLMLEVLKIPFLTSSKGLPTPIIFERGRPLNSFILGAAFAFGWTPCVGPVLGSILLLASSTTTVFQGAVLLAVFSLGLAVPFLAIAVGISRATAYLTRLAPLLRGISLVGGLLLVFLGILLFTNKMALLISWGYQFFNFINYSQLLNYL